MVINNLGNRLGIFFFYDEEGIVDSYVMYLLQHIQKSINKLVVVCNGVLTAESRQKFQQITSEVIVRENQGYDVGAYKTALEYIGLEELKNWDEIIFFNHTIMGPVYPFEDMFEEMSGRDVDFWGITKYGRESFDPFGYSPYGYLPEHIQSHFIVFRKSLVSSLDFQVYWESMPEINSYNESVGLFESLFTKKFEDKGFQWDVYVDTDDYESITTFPLMNCAKELIRDKKCPIFKRKTFFQPYDYVLGNTMGQVAIELLNYLDENTEYPIDMIWDNLLRTCHQADLVRTLHLNYSLPIDFHSPQIEKRLKNKKIVLVMHLYFPDLILESFHYASNMPPESDVYITTNSEEKKILIEKVFLKGNFHHCEVRVIENRGRDVSSLLVGVNDVIMNYDLACFVHDKKTTQIQPGSVGSGFAYKCYNNTLYSKDFVLNVLELFETNPRLGIASPPMPNHADYFPLLCNEWGPNYEMTRQLAEQLEIHVPMSQEKEPVAPFGTFFWFRPKAMEKLLKKGWEYQDFPPEPNNIDGTILHAIERLYPFVVQDAGYYPGVLMSSILERIEYTNLLYYVREYNKVITKNNNCNYFHLMREKLNEDYKQLKILRSENEQLRENNRILSDKAELFEAVAADLGPKASLKYQLKAYAKAFFHIK